MKKLLLMTSPKTGESKEEFAKRAWNELQLQMMDQEEPSFAQHHRMPLDKNSQDKHLKGVEE